MSSKGFWGSLLEIAILTWEIASLTMAINGYFSGETALVDPEKLSLLQNSRDEKQIELRAKWDDLLRSRK